MDRHDQEFPGSEVKQDHQDLLRDGDEHRAEKYEMVDRKRHPVNEAKSGGWRTTPFLYGLYTADNETFIIAFTMSHYLISHMHQSPSKAATIVSNFVGTNFLISVLGGFIADSYIGSFWTIVIGVVVTMLGYALVTFTTSYSGLQPASCLPNAPCAPAATHFMAPLYVSLYTIALGVGLVRPNLSAHGADQFDNSIPRERAHGTHFFAYLYCFGEVGNVIAIFPGVYLVDHVSTGWGYGASFILYGILAFTFFLATPLYRHRPPAGSFLTRTAQVLVAALTKRKGGSVPRNSQTLYDPLPTEKGSRVTKLAHTNKLRFLDRAAVISGPEDERIAVGGARPWKLCSVSQVEETKRILQVLPIWATTALVNIVYSQFTTFSSTAAATYDRRLGSHFTIPTSSVYGFTVLTSVILIPIYDKLVIPLVRRFTRCPYGFKPLQRLGASIFLASLVNIVGALLERKRLSKVRDLHLQNLELGAYTLPLKVWWLYPQYFLCSLSQISLEISSFEFFYREASTETRTLASSFTFSATAMGFYFSTVIVKLVNRTTRHHKGGSWLGEQLNNGGLEKYYWLLAIILAVDFIVYLFCVYWYEYKYDWNHESTAKGPSVDGRTRDLELSKEQRV